MDYFYPTIGIFFNICLISLVCICIKRRNQINRNNTTTQIQEPFIITHHYAIPVQYYPQPTAPQSTTSIISSLPYDNSNQLYTIYENDDKGNPVNY